jgi:hypothetical protein
LMNGCSRSLSTRACAGWRACWRLTISGKHPDPRPGSAAARSPAARREHHRCSGRAVPPGQCRCLALLSGPCQVTLDCCPRLSPQPRPARAWRCWRARTPRAERQGRGVRKRRIMRRPAGGASRTAGHLAPGRSFGSPGPCTR